MEAVSSHRVPRSPKCARCRNHGFVVVLKGHAGRCRFSRCGCWKCGLITERTRIMATQRGIRKRQRAMAHERDSGENSSVDGGPVSGVRERGAKSPARDTNTGHHKTYTELEVAAQTPSADDPEIAQMSSDHSEGARESAMSREQLLLPSQYMGTEIPRNPVYPGELPLAMPFHLHARYANAFAPPPFLLRFGAPPLGAFGFPHLPQLALTDSTQVGPGFFYTPYLFQPRPDHYHQYARERVDMSALQHASHSGAIEHSQQQTSKPSEDSS